MQQGILLRPRFKLLWNHEWGDTERDVAGRFETSLVTSAFTVQGAELTEDHAEVALGWEVGFVRNANLYLDWEGRFGKDLIENTLSVGGRIAW
jgi:outer membrane autotransporter protein